MAEVDLRDLKERLDSYHLVLERVLRALLVLRRNQDALLRKVVVVQGCCDSCGVFGLLCEHRRLQLNIKGEKEVVRRFLCDDCCVKEFNKN